MYELLELYHKPVILCFFCNSMEVKVDNENEISKSIEFVGKCIEEIGYDAEYRNMTIVDGLVSVADAINRLAEAVEKLKNNS